MVKELKSQRPALTVYPGNVSRFEQGVREPPLLVLLAYARAANVPIDVMVDDDMDLPQILPVRAAKRPTARRKNTN
jgi:transcriptional regulator with XRE-family HTH domain